jgi:hypothetical protein
MRRPTPVANDHPTIEATSFTNAPNSSSHVWHFVRLRSRAGREFMIPEETK